MTAVPGPGRVLVEDQLPQEPGHDMGADPGSYYGKWVAEGRGAGR